MLLLLITQPPAAQLGFVNLELALDDAWPALNASGQSDAVFWTADELIGFFEDASKRLARKTGAFVERNTELVSVAGQGSYTFPDRHIDTLQADLAGRTLRPRNIQQLEAVDADWPDTLAAADNLPVAFIQDTQGFDKIRVYPIPYLDGEVLGLFRSTFLEDFNHDQGLIYAMPPIIQDYFTFSAVAAARAKEGQGSMDEVVPWLRSVADLYEQLAGELWGSL